MRRAAPSLGATLRVLASVGVGAALLAVWAVTLRPAAWGGPTTYVVVRGSSMEPTYHTGDLVLVAASDRIRPGDVVAFQIPDLPTGQSAMMLHRVVDEPSGGALITRGDNNDVADEWSMTRNLIIGKAYARIPAAGRLLAMLRDPLLLASLSAGLVAGSFYAGDGSATVLLRATRRGRHRAARSGPTRHRRLGAHSV